MDGNPERLTLESHAKLNLLLRVLAREASGYHSIETVFALLDLADTVTAEKTSKGIELDVTGADVGPTEENLAYRGARQVLAATGDRFGVRIGITKRIPVGGGLGGGSSNCAAAMHLVNQLAGNALPRRELMHFGAQLGSDIPFFVSAAPLALAWGRGERLFRLKPPRPAPVLLAIPSFGMNTKEIYEKLAATEHTGRRGSIILDPGAFESWGSIARLGGNDLEAPAFGKRPELRQIFERMAQTRPLTVRMSGSGSTVFAIYKNENELEEARIMLESRDYRLGKTSTRSQPAAAVKSPARQ